MDWIVNYLVNHPYAFVIYWSVVGTTIGIGLWRAMK
jgi:hypothetical protein